MKALNVEELKAVWGGVVMDEKTRRHFPVGTYNPSGGTYNPFGGNGRPVVYREVIHVSGGLQGLVRLFL